MCRHHEHIEEDKLGFQRGECKLCGHVTEYGLIHDMLTKIDDRQYNPKGIVDPLTPYLTPSYKTSGIIIG